MTDKIAGWIADHLPKKIIYLATIRLAVYATSGKYSNTVVPDLTVVEALNRWEKNA